MIEIDNKCICFRCKANTKCTTLDCACDDMPIYDRDQCMRCPKRFFCDVTLQPWTYRDDDASEASDTDTKINAEEAS